MIIPPEEENAGAEPVEEAPNVDISCKKSVESVLQADPGNLAIPLEEETAGAEPAKVDEEAGLPFFLVTRRKCGRKTTWLY